MRIKNLIKGDMDFQFKYGFYFVYAIFTIFYILLLLVLPKSIRKEVGTILIYTDPAAMGLFFMGAIVLLEKSQRVLNSIAVSPVKVSEYIQTKVISLGIIATLVGVIIATVCGIGNIILVMLGTFFGSVIFSMMGLCIASKINSLNQFMIATLPFELICFIPAILYLFGLNKAYMLLHPGCVVIRLLQGTNGFEIVPFLLLCSWILMIYYITVRIVRKMFQSVGGVKL